MGDRRFFKERWTEAASRGLRALEDLQGIQEEIAEWEESLGNLRKARWNILFDDFLNLDLEPALKLLRKAQSFDIPSARG